MSSMDTGNQLRSQEFVQRSEMQSQSLRQDSANQMVGGLQHTVEAARQFAILDAEAKARLQMHEQEMQINAVKLQHMQALDATDLMGEQVRGAKLDNDMKQQQLDRQKRLEEGLKGLGMDEATMTLLDKMGEGARYFYAPKEGGGIRVLTPAEAEEARKHGAATRTTPTYTDLRGEWAKLLDQGDYEAAAAVKELMDAMKEKGGMGATPTPKPKAPPSVPMDPKLEADLAPAMKAVGTVTKDPAEQKAIVHLAWSKRAEIAAVMNAARNKENQPTPFSEQDAFQTLIDAISNPRHPMHAQARAYIRSIGGPDIGYVPTPGIVAPVVLRGDIPR